jgi:glycosyltransferase involved in cell wall biosynthesis
MYFNYTGGWPPKPMTKVAIDVRMISHSGIGTYVSHLVPRVVRAAQDLYFYLLGPVEKIREHGWEALENTGIVDIRSPIYSVGEQLELAWKLPGDASVVWSPHYNIPLLYRRKLLTTVHDVCHLAMPQFFKGIAKRSYAHFMFAAIRSRADRVICVSRFSAGELARFAGLSGDKITVIHPGVDHLWFCTGTSERLHPGPYLIAVGNLKPHKNITNLIAAFSLVQHKIPHDLIIVGKNYGFMSRDKQIDQHVATLSNRIVFTGQVTNERLRAYMRNAEALVFPSKYEGFGLPPLEAMACGCPAVVTNAASVPEACGDAALYFDPYDEVDIAEKILYILENPDVRNDFRRKGIDRARIFSWDDASEKTLLVLRDLIGI